MTHTRHKRVVAEIADTIEHHRDILVVAAPGLGKLAIVKEAIAGLDRGSIVLSTMQYDTVEEFTSSFVGHITDLDLITGEFLRGNDGMDPDREAILVLDGYTRSLPEIQGAVQELVMGRGIGGRTFAGLTPVIVLSDEPLPGPEHDLFDTVIVL